MSEPEVVCEENPAAGWPWWKGYAFAIAKMMATDQGVATRAGSDPEVQAHLAQLNAPVSVEFFGKLTGEIDRGRSHYRGTREGQRYLNDVLSDLYRVLRTAFPDFLTMELASRGTTDIHYMAFFKYHYPWFYRFVKETMEVAGSTTQLPPPITSLREWNDNSVPTGRRFYDPTENDDGVFISVEPVPGYLPRFFARTGEAPTPPTPAPEPTPAPAPEPEATPPTPAAPAPSAMPTDPIARKMEELINEPLPTRPAPPGTWSLVESQAERRKRLGVIVRNLPALRKLADVHSYVKNGPYVWQDKHDADVFASVWLIKNGSIVLKGVPGCMTGDSFFVGADGGLTQFDEFAHLRPGIYPLMQSVLCDDGKTALSTALHIYEVGEVVEVTTEHGKTLTLTHNHPLMTKTGWKPIDDIEVGEEIKILNSLPSVDGYVPTNFRVDRSTMKRNTGGWGHVLPNEHKVHITLPAVWDKSLGFVFGAFMAEGCVDRNRVTFVLNTKETEFRDQIIEDMARNFGLIRPTLKDRAPKNATEICYHSKELNQVFAIWKDRRVPWAILQSPNDVVAGFLSALFEGDGTINHHDDTRRVRLKSTTKKLIDAVQLLLLRFGISTTISSYQPNDKRGYNSQRVYTIDIGRKEDLETFRDEIGFVSTKKRDRLQGMMGTFTTKNTPKKSVWEKLTRKATVCGPTRVYDIEVPATNSFVTNGGIVSHNTGKTQLVEMTALLFCNDVLTLPPEERKKKLTSIQSLKEWLRKQGVIGEAKHNQDKEIQDIFFTSSINIERYRLPTELQTPLAVEVVDGVPANPPVPSEAEQDYDKAGFREINELEKYAIFPVPRDIVTSIIKFHNEANRMNVNVADTLLGMMSEGFVEFHGKSFQSPGTMIDGKMDPTIRGSGQINIFDYNPHLEVEYAEMELDRALLDRITAGIFIPAGDLGVRLNVVDKTVRGLREAPRDIAFRDIAGPNGDGVGARVTPLTKSEFTSLWDIVPLIPMDEEVMSWISFLTNFPNLCNRRFNETAYIEMPPSIDDTDRRPLPVDQATYADAIMNGPLIRSGVTIETDLQAGLDAITRPMGVRGALALADIYRGVKLLETLEYAKNAGLSEVDTFEALGRMKLYIKDEADRDRVFADLTALLPYVMDHRVNLGVTDEVKRRFLNANHFFRYYFKPMLAREVTKSRCFAYMFGAMTCYMRFHGQPKKPKAEVLEAFYREVVREYNARRVDGRNNWTRATVVENATDNALLKSIMGLLTQYVE